METARLQRLCVNTAGRLSRPDLPETRGLCGRQIIRKLSRYFFSLGCGRRLREIERRYERMSTGLKKPKEGSENALKIGWGSADLTPAEPVSIAGQFHVRISEGVMDPVTATALAISSGDDGVVLVSCDLVVIPDGLLNSVRELACAGAPGLKPGNVILNATHAHTAPEVRTSRDYEMSGGVSWSGMAIELPIMDPEDYAKIAAARIADAVKTAWEGRRPGSVAFGLGHAVVGRNRRSCYLNGESRMYGKTASDDFSHIEGYEDHSVNLLGTWDGDGRLTGLVVNIACPSQVSESLFQLSADYWHDVRTELRRRLGDGLFVLPQCSTAGDQSPHVQVCKAAEERMANLAGLTQRQEIGTRVADAVDAALPLMKKERLSDLVFRHLVDRVDLARRRLSQSDVDEAAVEAGKLKTEYERLLKELEAHPGKRSEPRWYVPITRAFRRMRWYQGVIRRFEDEKERPRLSFEVHALRLGDMAVATNPFEYYLDFGMRIKARSPAVQTFLVQLSGCGTYVPTARAVAGRSYGAIPASTPIGPEGGQELAEWTVSALRKLW